MLTQARLELCRARPYLAWALGRLEPVVSEEYEPASVDGERFFCHPQHVQDAAMLLAHGLCHCLLGHVFLRDASALACDLAVALVMAELMPEFCTVRGNGMFQEAQRRCMGLIEIERLEALLWEDDYLRGNRLALTQLLKLDSHAAWRTAQERLMFPGGAGLAELWRRERRRLPTGFGGRGVGREPGTHREKVALGEGEHHEFAKYLRRYAVVRENARDDPDAFQYSWYAYGLERYGNMPLIEPVEYREERRLEELVIAIDTSASCVRGLTKRFLELTRDILLREDLFFRRFNLHILQCDARIQADHKIVSLTEFERYIAELEIRGGGGTDFRPAFDYVEALIARGELRNLKGMLYFTDGRGIYPSAPPEYEALFVFLKHRYDDIDTPPWARKLVLDAPMPRGDEYMEY